MGFNSFSLYTFLCILNLIFANFDIMPVVYRILTIAIILWSFYNVYYVNVKLCPNIYIKGLNIITLIIVIYGSLLLISDTVLIKQNVTIMSNYTYIVINLYSVLPIYSYYYYAQKGDITENTVRLLFYVLFACYILIFMEKLIIGGADYDEFGERTNNRAYLLVSLIPMLFLFKQNKLYKIGALMIIVLLTIYSAKRGAMLVGFVSLFFFFIRKKTSMVTKILCIVGFAVLYTYIDVMIENSDALQRKINMTMEGDTNNRDEIYAIYFDYFMSPYNSAEWWFGNGAEGTIKIFGYHAHNDWLEFAIGQGIFGVFAYMFYWVTFVIGSKRIIDSEKRITSYVLCMMYFLISIYSMSLNNIPLAASFAIGYVMADRKKIE